MPYLFSVSQYPQFAQNLALILVHEHLLLPKNWEVKGNVPRVTAYLQVLFVSNPDLT